MDTTEAAAAHARDAFNAIQDASYRCLKALKIPTQPTGKTRSWKQGSPSGVLYHYTAGGSGISNCRWFNDPIAGNRGSSCHFVVFDRVPKELEDIWRKTQASQLFAVPVIQLAPLTQGTWHGNWANSRLLGVEIVNAGKLQSGTPAKPGKPLYTAPDGSVWDGYWRGQIEAAVTIGRLIAASKLGVFEPQWVAGHSQVWAEKSDPGPAFPTMHEIRNGIFAAKTPTWLDRFTADPLGSDNVAEALEPLSFTGLRGETRGEPVRSELPWHAYPDVAIVPRPEDEPEVSWLLYKLGWPTDGVLSKQALRQYVEAFQRSTLAYAQSRPYLQLQADGVAGPKTLEALRRRVREVLALRPGAALDWRPGQATPPTNA